MKERMYIAGLLFVAMMASTSSAQVAHKVAQLGRMPVNGKVKQVGLLAKFFGHGSSNAGCDGCADPACGAPEPMCGCEAPVPDCGCAAPAPDCGCAAPVPECGMPEPACGMPGMPSCGSAGGILGKFKGKLGGFGGLRGMLGGFAGGAACGCETMEPDCGVTGLGYSGGFGLCGGCGGGGCDSCGVGGFFGRNIHRVEPCACGGSIFGDKARNFLSFFDQAVGTLAGSFVGGLRAAGGHARGSLAALHSAKSCGGCADAGCDSCSAPTSLAPGGCALGVCGDPLGCGTGCDSGCSSAPAAEGYIGAPLESAPAVSYPMAAPVESYPSNTYTEAPTEDIYLPPPSPPVTESVPVETHSMPMEPNIIEPAPVDATPIESVPMESTPVESAPIDTSPIDSSPLDNLPGGLDIDTSPLDTVPIRGTDPFVDDPAPLSQRQTQPRKAVASGFRFFKGGNPFRQQATTQQRATGYQFAPQQQRVARQVAPSRTTASRSVGAASRTINQVAGTKAISRDATSKVRQAVSQVEAARHSTAKRYLPRAHKATMRR